VPVLLVLVAAELAVLALSYGKAAGAQQTAAAALAAVQVRVRRVALLWSAHIAA
jgi:hypothetical protein